MVAELDRLSGSGLAHMGDRRAHGPKIRLGAQEGIPVASDHDRKRSVLGADRAAGHGRIEERHAYSLKIGMHAPDGDRRDRAHVDEEPAPWRRRQKAAFAIDDLFDLRRVGEHGNDDIRVPCGIRQAFGAGSAMGEEIIHGFLADVVGTNSITCLEQIEGHFAPHRPQADKADCSLLVVSLHHAVSLLNVCHEALRDPDSPIAARRRKSSPIAKCSRMTFSACSGSRPTMASKMRR